MNHNMGTHPISVGNTSSAANHVTQSSVLTSIPNQAAYLAFQNSADSYNGQFAVFDSKPSYMPHVSKEAHLYDSHCGLYGMQSPPNMSPSPPPPPRVYKPCVVCNDKSSGYHYGVSSCEGCKGFFRRSVQKNMQYTCHKDKHCPINKVTRNRCQYCRLQKCFGAGMSKEAVRNDRNKKRKPKPESASSSSEDLTGDDQTLIQDILDAHRTTSVSDEVDDASSSSPSPDVKEEKKEGGILWERISELSSDGVVKIVDFAKKIPGFSSLSQSDQITLLKAACLEIMILRLSARYDIDSDRMVFTNGLSFDKDQLQEGGFGTLTGTIFSFAASLKAMNIDEAEFAILSAICLMSGDRSGLQDTEKIEQMQEPLLEALKHYTRSRRQDQPHIFAKLLMKLTDLRSISVKGEKQTLRFALDHLANALSLLEAPVSTPEISTVKTEPYSLPLDEPSCSGISSTVNLPNYDPHAKSLPQQQRMERAGPSGSMDYGRQMSSDYLASSGSLGPLPDSSIPSPLGMGLPPMQLSPNQISSVMASIESPSPSSLPTYPSVPSPSMPSYLTGLSPTLSPNFTFAPSTVSSILTSPIPSPGVDNNVLANLHTTISDRNGQSSNLPRHMAMTSQANTSQADLMLRNGHMMSSAPMSQAPDLENGKRYNGDRNNSNSYNTNCLSFMGVPASLNAAPFSLGETVASSTSDHHTPFSKIIAGAMTDTMQI